MSSTGSDNLTGRRVGPYLLAEPIGQGASATVYRGHADDREHAIKIRRRGNPAMDRRFLREFESMRLLRLPGVVQVHEAGIENDWLWFSMDVIDGMPFDEALSSEGYIVARVDRTIELGRQLCEVLASLHEQGFVHRDVKPSNVLVDRSGTVQVLDFGIGRYFGDPDTSSGGGEVLGTIPYMSPEQVAGLPTDGRSDLYSAGVMLWEAIAGKRQRPLTPMAWIPRICLDGLWSLATRMREVPLGLSKLLEDLTRVDPCDRPTGRLAALAFRRLAAGDHDPEWPEPCFQDPGTFWAPLEGCIGDPDHPPVWVVEGQAGSGRGRLAEQIHRAGLMDNVWTLHLRCVQDRVAGPLQDLLELLVTFLDEEALAAVIGDAAEPIRQVWPHLPLARRADPVGSTGRVTDAIAAVVRRLSERRPILIVVHDLEQIDPVSARTLPSIAAFAGLRFGLLVLHEPRWASAASRALVGQLRALGAGHLEIPPLSPAAAAAIAAAICPALPPPVPQDARPQLVVEAAWAALAKWRGVPFPPLDPSLWPLAVQRGPIPARVWRALAGERAPLDGWARPADSGVELAGRTAWTMARARLAPLRKVAAILAKTWQDELGDAARPGDVAALWTLALDPDAAFMPAARAAQEADRAGRWNDARRWMLLIDTMPHQLPEGAPLMFDLAWLAAHVALRTDASSTRPDLLSNTEQLARTPDQEQRVRLLQCEWHMRGGNVRAALVTALRVASSPTARPEIAAAALFLAAQARIVGGQLADAPREIERGIALLGPDPDPVLRARATNLEAELAFHQHDLLSCRTLCQRAIRVASEHGDVRGAASASSRLGQVLRLLGRRREAEHNTRAAREAFAATGDAQLDADTGLALATLLVERGETLGARHLLNDAIHRVNALGSTHLLPSAWRVALQIATARADVGEANTALQAIQGLPAQDPETPAVLVRWWRTRADFDRALSVPAPPRETWGHVVWRIERARAMLCAVDPAAAREARAAVSSAERLGFTELEVYGGLVLAGAGELDDAAIADVGKRAQVSLYSEVVLGQIEMEGRRLAARGDREGARSRWMTLLARAQELGNRPAADEALGWLGIPSPPVGFLAVAPVGG